MSWVVVNKETGKAVFETYLKSVADKVNTEKYRVVPILEYLYAINAEIAKKLEKLEKIDQMKYEQAKQLVLSKVFGNYSEACATLLQLDKDGHLKPMTLTEFLDKLSKDIHHIEGEDTAIPE